MAINSFLWSANISKMTTVFEAKYEGECVWCLEVVEVGQRACFWRQRLHHEECKKEAYKEHSDKPGHKYPNKAGGEYDYQP